MPEHVHVVAHFRFRPEALEAAEKICRGLLVPTRSEWGCLRYECFRDQEDRQAITFIEEWSSTGALDAHLASAHVRAAFAEAAPLFAEEPRILRYTKLG